MENQTDTNEWHWWTSRIFLEVARVQAPSRTAPPSVTAWGRGLCRTCAALTWAGGAIRGLHTASVEAPWPLGGGPAPTHCSRGSEVFPSIQTRSFFHTNLSIGVSSPVRKTQVAIVAGTEGNVHPRPRTPGLLAPLRLAAPGGAHVLLWAS